ncbi:MAG: mannitol/fructose-specific phosphotransferase system IIA component (Ntr-type), partial [Planctomycetota bacterium]
RGPRPVRRLTPKHTVLIIMRTEAADYWKLFKPSACNVKLKGTTQESVFGEIAAGLVKSKGLPAEMAEGVVQVLVQREELASTGIGQTVAIPHVKIEGLEEALVSLSVHPAGLDWRSLDGLPVHLLFTVLRPAQAGPKHDPERHLAMMRWVSLIGQQADFRRFALNVGTRTELVDLLKEISGKLA